MITQYVHECDTAKLVSVLHVGANLCQLEHFNMSSGVWQVATTVKEGDEAEHEVRTFLNLWNLEISMGLLRFVGVPC